MLSSDMWVIAFSLNFSVTKLCGQHRQEVGQSGSGEEGSHSVGSPRARMSWLLGWAVSPDGTVRPRGAESRGRRLSLKGTSPLPSSALEALINFAYNGHLAIDQQNVQSLLMGASFLQLQSIKDACCTFLQER